MKPEHAKIMLALTCAHEQLSLPYVERLFDKVDSFMRDCCLKDDNAEERVMKQFHKDEDSLLKKERNMKDVFKMLDRTSHEPYRLAEKKITLLASLMYLMEYESRYVWTINMLYEAVPQADRLPGCDICGGGPPTSERIEYLAGRGIRIDGCVTDELRNSIAHMRFGLADGGIVSDSGFTDIEKVSITASGEISSLYWAVRCWCSMRV